MQLNAIVWKLKSAIVWIGGWQGRALTPSPVCGSSSESPPGTARLSPGPQHQSSHVWQNPLPGSSRHPQAVQLVEEGMWVPAKPPQGAEGIGAERTHNLPKCKKQFGRTNAAISEGAAGPKGLRTVPKPAPPPSDNTVLNSPMSPVLGSHWVPLPPLVMLLTPFYYFFFPVWPSLFFIVITLHYQFNLFPFLFMEHTLSWHKSHETK